MLHKTRGIVLGHIKYRERSIIASIFTETLGMQSYVVHGVRTQRPQHGRALFQSLTLLDMVVYHSRAGSLQRVAEVKCNRPSNHTLKNIKKTTVAVFLADLLVKVLRKEECNGSLFSFLWRAFVTLEEQRTGYEFFYLSFMLQLCHYLGFGIATATDIYTQLYQSGQHWGIDQQTIRGLDGLLKLDSESSTQLSVDRLLKRKLLDVIIRFYHLHTGSLGDIKSLGILRALS